MQVKFKLTAVATLVFLAGAASAQDMVVKIGHVGPISGSIAHLGKAMKMAPRWRLKI